MYLLICQRESAAGETVFIPIMKDSDDGEPGFSMATWETDSEVKEFCRTHILAKSSINIIIDEEGGGVEFI